jgi:Protein of unknown function (DUF2950)
METGKRQIGSAVAIVPVREPVIVQAEGRARLIGQAAAELELAPAAVELEPVPVAGVPELALAVELPRDQARSPQHVPAEAAGPTRLETAAPRPVQVHAGVGLGAAEAETQLARVAAVVARVWAAAGTAVVAAVMVVVAAAVLGAAAAVEAAAAAEAAAEVGDKQRRNKVMSKNLKTISSSKILLVTSAAVACAFLASVSLGAEETKQDTAAAAQSGQKQFASAKEAADALVQAAASFDQAALKEILGPESDDIIASEDPVQDKNRAVAFAKMAKEKTNIEKKGDHAILEVGKDDFPLPIPIVNRKGKWAFDTKVGKEEILNRRIGSNELDAITVCRGFDDAQKEYAQEKHDDSKVNQYAQKIISTPGKHDGLAWKNPDGTWGGPVGETVAKALEQGYTEQGKPYHGYYFKVLTKQGPNAPMGEMDFVIGGAMIGGFGLAAAPAEYRVTGVKTFMVGPDGVVYEKDLGADTLKTFQSMEAYNPDKTWKVTEDEWPEEEEAPTEEASLGESPGQ